MGSKQRDSSGASGSSAGGFGDEKTINVNLTISEREAIIK